MSPGGTRITQVEQCWAASADGATVEGLDVKSKAGLFFSEADGQPLRLAVDNGRLRIAGGPVLDPVTRDRFRNPRGILRFMSADEFELHMVSPDQIELTSMDGKTTRYRRAQAYAPSADDLKAFAGRYGNDESRAVFEIEPGKSGLTLRVGWNHSQAFPFSPVDRDTFQLGGMIVRFHRDDAGNPVGFDYSNPVVRNIEFKRLSESTSGR